MPKKRCYSIDFASKKTGSQKPILIFLASPDKDDYLRKLAHQKITQWNNNNQDTGYVCYPMEWNSDIVPRTCLPPNDGQFEINEQLIKKCDLLFAFLINAPGSRYKINEYEYPCATLYEVDYHIHSGSEKQASIFLTPITKFSRPS